MCGVWGECGHQVQQKFDHHGPILNPLLLGCIMTHPWLHSVLPRLVFCKPDVTACKVSTEDMQNNSDKQKMHSSSNYSW